MKHTLGRNQFTPSLRSATDDTIISIIVCKIFTILSGENGIYRIDFKSATKSMDTYKDITVDQCLDKLNGNDEAGGFNFNHDTLTCELFDNDNLDAADKKSWITYGKNTKLISARASALIKL